MHVIWVKVGGLWPLNTGGRLRSFHILAGLARRHRVTLLTTHGTGDDPHALQGRLPAGTEVISVPHVIPKQGSPAFALALLRSWPTPLPVDLWRWHVPALRQELSRRLVQADLCVADFLAAVANVPVDGPAPVVLFAHNVEHVIWKRLAQVEPRFWRRALLEVEWRKLRRWEASACRRVRRTIAVSEVDGRMLAALAPRADVCAIPTGVDIAYFVSNGVREMPARLVFTGSMDWYPNEDAMVHFIDAVLPLIRRQVPDALLTVVGRNPGPRLRGLAADRGVRVTGTVEDVRPYLAEASVFVVPLRVGGGTRLKIFEALAMGKAVVSTSVGAEGLPLVSGEHFLRADDPLEFAQAVTSLLRDPARRRTLGAAGQRLMEERYSWDKVATEFEARCEEVLTHAG